MGFFSLSILLIQINSASLTPNGPLRQTSFTYQILNMDDFSLLAGLLGYVDSTEEVERNSLHAERGNGRSEK